VQDLRVGIIGCGKMGREHVRAARSLGARVVWLGDADPSRASALAAQCEGSEAAAEVGAVRWSALDAIFLCTPPSARGPVEREAIEAGVPFFVEKPVGPSAAQVASVLHALRAKPTIHSVGYMNRYRASVRRARDRLAGARVVATSCAWVGKVYARPWWLAAAESGGPFNEQATHLVDLCRFLAGPIAEVSALARPSPDHPGVDDTVAVALRFASGACGTLLHSYLASDKHIGFEVFTTAGSVRLEGWGFSPAGEGGVPAGSEEDVIRVEVAAFLDAVRTGDQTLVESDFEDALRTQLAVDAILRSIRSGRPERVAELA
jgi:myo-inositol 2-dehydrogenase / D-chiro-inositol 1-dehydrogenase